MWPEPDQTQDLLANIKDGDAAAVNRLIERHRQAVERLVKMRLDQKIQHRVAVSDVVQDVLIEANRRLQDYVNDPKLTFHLWLRQITKDRIIDAHRRHRGSAKRSVDREQAIVAPGNMHQSTMDLMAQVCDHELTPAAAATQKEMARRVEQAITQLGEQDAEVVVMRHYEKLTNQEVAEVLGLSEPAAGMRYLRAVRRLREILGEPPANNAS